MAFVAETPLLGIEIDRNIPGVIAIKNFIAGYPSVAIGRVRIGQQFGLEIPAPGVRKRGCMSPMAREAHDV